jgi:serine-type D-Ala-D-Ala carboxypeptidase/endopeptidase (penicillin-binding protein 4)
MPQFSCQSSFNCQSSLLCVQSKAWLGLLLPIGLLLNGFGNSKPDVMQEMRLPDSIGLGVLQDTPWTVLSGDADAGAEAIVRDYLNTLKSQGLNPSEQGIWLQSGPSLLVENQGKTPLSAASLTKITTTLAALETWGPQHQFTTTIGVTGPIQNGVLQGDLVIQGSADPMFVWEEAIALGNKLNELGIQQVMGDLVIAGPFIMNFEVNPGKAGGFLYQALNSKSWPGEISEQYSQMKPKPPAKPTIAIAGKVRLGDAGNATPIIQHQSLPVLHLLKRLNVYSNNVMSETLSQLLGGAEATRQKAAAAAGLSPDEILLINGSGLGTENRISPRASMMMFSAIARYAERNGFTVADLFPISGTDIGTLIDRNIPKNAVVKTGTLNEVCALSGVLPTQNRGLVWFSIINRGTNIEGLRQQQDVLLSRLQAHWGSPKSRSKRITSTSVVTTPISLLGAPERNVAVMP